MTTKTEAVAAAAKTFAVRLVETEKRWVVMAVEKEAAMVARDKGAAGAVAAVEVVHTNVGQNKNS